jgi:hypothetical protein
MFKNAFHVNQNYQKNQSHDIQNPKKENRNVVHVWQKSKEHLFILRLIIIALAESHGIYVFFYSRGLKVLLYSVF